MMTETSMPILCDQKKNGELHILCFNVDMPCSCDKTPKTNDELSDMLNVHRFLPTTCCMHCDCPTCPGVDIRTWRLHTLPKLHCDDERPFDPDHTVMVVSGLMDLGDLMRDTYDFDEEAHTEELRANPFLTHEDPFEEHCMLRLRGYGNSKGGCNENVFFLEGGTTDKPSRKRKNPLHDIYNVDVPLKHAKFTLGADEDEILLIDPSF